MNSTFPKFNLKEWIEDHRHLLKPPVGNKCVWDEGEFIVMVVGGPNSRKDYHLNKTPEFFYQVEGEITLKIITDKGPEDVKIGEGEIYLLPSNIPHSPQRGKDTVGLVIEQKRSEGMTDGLAWYCENCNQLLYQSEFFMNNIEKDLPVLFDEFYSNKDLCTCSECGTVMNPPKKLSS